MRIVPRRWSNETWLCSLRGHVTPASAVRTVRPVDAGIGFDRPGNRRFARCLRCDVWLDTEKPEGADLPETLPPIEDLEFPRRGRALEDAIVLRIIAIERAVHSIGFTLLAIGLALLEVNLGHVHRFGANLAHKFSFAATGTGRHVDHSFLSRSLNDLITLRRSDVQILLVTAIAYAVLEGVEAVGLWKERTWAEYLTVVATVGLLPFEVYELIQRVTLFRVSALAVNLAVLVWLLWAKRLFGLRGGRRALEARAAAERAEVIEEMSQTVPS